MSTFNDIDIECPSCGEEYRGTVWVGVHAGQNPELKELLLGGELNLVSCPGCSEVSFHDHFLIYQEPAAELVAYVYPEAQRGEEESLRRLMVTGFKEAQAAMDAKQRLSYDPILLFGLESLIELLQEEEARAEQSQIAEAYCKQNKIETFMLRPAQARQLQTVRVLPRAGTERPPTRAHILEGINRLLEMDPVLDQYTQLKGKIEADTNWKLS